MVSNVWLKITYPKGVWIFCSIFSSALLLAFSQCIRDSSALCPALSIRNVGVNELTGARFLLSSAVRCSSLFGVFFIFFIVVQVKYAFLKYIYRKKPFILLIVE